ncbi:hypothetical protein JCM19239_5042 [Vibrio variabilis]|uniref:Uncharacterized protein n=1 Tax=Vibrio variabilis TaxID=990271 RepID=A0ABQ0JJJ9_9VIBR|nr:hypothetical protein JCM19239_5042 [Vibrio variabilis]
MKMIKTTLFAGLMAASVIANAAEPQLTDEQLQMAMETRLVEQLKDPQAAKLLSEFLIEDVLTWRAETLDIKEADSILAFAFGNRHAENGNQIPGPMNSQLADLAVELHKETGKPVYAQWEIAQQIGDRVAEDKLFPIYPTVNEGGELIYLNTTGVALDAVKQAGGFEKMGKTIVLAFYEHNLRAVNTAREAGLEAFAPAGYEMPSDYDANSGNLGLAIETPSCFMRLEREPTQSALKSMTARSTKNDEHHVLISMFRDLQIIVLFT